MGIRLDGGSELGTVLKDRPRLSPFINRLLLRRVEMNHFIMGGYALYVWPAYGIALVVLLTNFLTMKWKQKQTRQKLQQWFKR